MKHTKPAILFLITFFFITQIVGLVLISADISHEESNLKEVRPQTEGYQSFLFLGFGVIIGTIIVLLLVKYNKRKIWKYWFLLAVFLAISFGLRVFLPVWLSYLLAFILAVLKIHRPTVLTHNITEVLMYAGIAVLLTPIFDLRWAAILLVAISFYDVYAVWKSKHMVKMAQFMSKSNFAGLVLPYNNKGSKIKGRIKSQELGHKPENKVAILGGGDVAFPLIFSGVTLEWYVSKGFSVINSFYLALIVSLFAGVAVYLLFLFGKNEKFYPAMPFISIGCFTGIIISYFISPLLI